MRSMSILPKEGLETIFSNTEQLIQLHQDFLFQLNSRKIRDLGVIQEIGDIFVGIADKLKIYCVFCTNHSVASEYLINQKNQGDLKIFLQYCSLRPECRGMDLSSFLLKPIQRICKYPLLLREIKKHTPDTHADSCGIDDAILKITGVVDYVNEKRRRAEQDQQLEITLGQLEFSDVWMLPTLPERVVICESILTKVSDKSIKMIAAQRMCVLFRDCFVIAKLSLFSGGKAQVSSIHSIWTVTVSDIPDTDTSHSRVSSECAYPSVDESIEEHQSSYTNGDDDATNYSDACFPHSMEKWGISQNVTGSCPARPNMQPLELGLDSQGSNSGLGISHESLSLQHYQSLDTIAGLWRSVQCSAGIVASVYPTSAMYFKSSSIEDIPKLTEGGLGLDTCSRMGDHSSANEKYTLISARSSGQ
ncbi:hypothetical protein BSLG_003737 [Batrachochytrium salamandrivorans]|nr:hypothetical protein BSLG_003737 [Batrachochytrium salamandrivorans]